MFLQFIGSSRTSYEWKYPAIIFGIKIKFSYSNLARNNSMHARARLCGHRAHAGATGTNPGSVELEIRESRRWRRRETTYVCGHQIRPGRRARPGRKVLAWRGLSTPMRKTSLHCNPILTWCVFVTASRPFAWAFHIFYTSSISIHSYINCAIKRVRYAKNV